LLHEKTSNPNINTGSAKVKSGIAGQAGECRMALYTSWIERGIFRAGPYQEVAMSRYHPVRPKPNHKHHQVPTPAAPAQSKETADAKALNARIEAGAAEAYRYRNGLELEASIARAKKLLAIYDRELEVVAKGNGDKQHRWTISPSIAFRYDKLLHELLQRRERLMAECYFGAKEVVTEEAAGEKADSLCPPKSPEPANQAESQPGMGETPAQRESADAPVIAA